MWQAFKNWVPKIRKNCSAKNSLQNRGQKYTWIWATKRIQSQFDKKFFLQYFYKYSWGPNLGLPRLSECTNNLRVSIRDLRVARQLGTGAKTTKVLRNWPGNIIWQKLAWQYKLAKIHTFLSSFDPLWWMIWKLRSPLKLFATNQTLGNSVSQIYNWRLNCRLDPWRFLTKRKSLGNI